MPLLAVADEIQQIHVSELEESPENPRTISEERFEALKSSLQKDPEMMRARPIIATPEGEVVAGNMRLRACRELGVETVPVFVKEFEHEGQKREWMLRDNQEYGEWVPDELASVIARHAEQGYDTSMLGFTDDEVMAAIRRVTGEAIVPEPSDPPEPRLAAEVMVEIRCTKQALEQISPTLEEWADTLTGFEVNVTS